MKPLNSTLPIVVPTNNAETGLAQDAGSAPTFTIRAVASSTVLVSGTLTRMSEAQYEFLVNLTTANGFMVGTNYVLTVTTTVGGLAGKRCEVFRVTAAEAVTGKTPATIADPVTLADGAITSDKIADSTLTAAKVGADLLTAVAAAVWGVLTSGITAAGSVGKLLVEMLDVPVSTAGVGGDGPGGIHILPLVSLVSTEPVQRLPLTGYRLAQITHRVAVHDSQGHPIDLTQMTLNFVLSTLTGVELAHVAAVTAEGEDSNIATWTIPAAAHAAAGRFRYAVRDAAAGDANVIHGEYLIEPLAGPHVTP